MFSGSYIKITALQTGNDFWIYTQARVKKFGNILEGYEQDTPSRNLMILFDSCRCQIQLMQPVVIHINWNFPICQYVFWNFLIVMEVMVERILELMSSQKITARELTSKLELSNSAITDWKKGKAKPSTDAIIKIAAFFQVSTDYLLTGRNPPSHLIKSEDAEWLSLLHQLDEDDRKAYFAEIKGFIKGKSSTK